ncbi:MAG: CDP-alcohol phosphatidyltransferase family protein [Candidatus Korarchaeota archaeon]|nr:CDP-alcohol phosphatidyltransferase family protein [Thermoproteota archaeon]MCR8470585.1 CDP-alcohol phosphatidyltransferase family protein [Thermoproteota archaeon]
MTEYTPNYRKVYERKTIIIGKVLSKLGFTPTMMTASSVVIACISLYYFAHRDLLMALVIIVLAGIFDVFDGAIARATGKVSKYGTLLDNTTDRVVEGIMIMGLMIGSYVRSWIALLTLLAMFLPSYIRARGEAELHVKALGVGLFERKEKLGTLFGGIILAWYFGNRTFQFSYVSLSILEIICLIITIGSIITSFQRLAFFSQAEKHSLNCLRDQNQISEFK